MMLWWLDDWCKHTAAKAYQYRESVRDRKTAKTRSERVSCITIGQSWLILTFIYRKLAVFVIVEQDLFLVWSCHKDDLIPQSLWSITPEFVHFLVTSRCGHETVCNKATSLHRHVHTYDNIYHVTLIALAELGSPSSTSSSSTPPRPSWSCLSSSLSKAFLSLRLYLGLKPYVPSRTSIFGLFTKA